MREVVDILDEVFVGQERVSRDEIYRRVVVVDAPTEIVNALDGLPEGEYAQDEIIEALRQIGEPAPLVGAGVPAGQLSDVDLLREMADVHRTRNDTLRHGSDQALAHHDDRTAELETEYLKRYPEREIDPRRLREGARAATEDEFQEPDRAGGPGPRNQNQRNQNQRNPRGRSPRRQSGREPQVRTGSEQPWDPEDVAVAEGHTQRPADIERARRELAEDGPATIERTVP